MNSIIQTGIFILTLLLVVNVTVINLFVLRSKSVANEQISIVTTNNSDVPLCDDACQKSIANDVLSQFPTPMEKVHSPDAMVVKQKEYILPIGSGSTHATEWQDIPGAEITIDSSNYKPIKKVIFEAYVSIPTSNGTAFVKLFNVTDKREVWFSEVSMETNATTRKEAPIQIEPGEKTYRVMMKTTMGYEAILHNARIRIISG